MKLIASKSQHHKVYTTILLFLFFSLNLNSQDLIKKIIRPVIIQGKLSNMKNDDTLLVDVVIYRYGFSAIAFQNKVTIGKPPFELNVGSISEPSYLALRIDSAKKSRLLTPFYLIEPDDTIVIHKRGEEFILSSKKNQFSLLMQVSKTGDVLSNKRWGPLNRMKPILEDFLFRDSITLVELNLLDSIRNKISKTAYYLSKIDILYGNQTSKMLPVFSLINKDNYLKFPSKTVYAGDSHFPDYPSIGKSLTLYDDVIDKQLQYLSSDYRSLLPFSLVYIKYVDVKYRLDSCIAVDRPFDFERYYSYLRKNFSGLLRERLIVGAINSNLKSAIDLQYFLSDALSFVNNPDFRKFLLYQQSRANGNAAYKFELPDIKGNTIRLDSLKGKVVVLDFWFTGCPGCVQMYPKIENVINYFKEDSRVVFVSISIDEDKQIWLKSVAEGDKNGRYTSTDKKNVINLYTAGLGKTHPLVQYHRVVGYPTLILIDQEGNIGKVPTDPRSGDDGKGMIKQIQDLL